MAHRIVRAGAALATAVLLLPTAAFADESHDHASPSAEPHAGHADHAKQASPSADPHDGHAEHEANDEETHSDHGSAGGDQSGGHSDHGSAGGGQSGGHTDHDATTTDDDAGHTDHGTQLAEVSPEVRNFVLSGFAGVNAAVVFGAWLHRRTGSNPDPRKRTPKASR